ncbi:MAG: hypothetical protein QM762_13155 [Chryseolinea sp.]
MSQHELAHDIFVSYRHNDNRDPCGKEGWVSDFVSHLAAELETMVKGKVSVYFDRNSSDGLREHHQVDDSLTGHLKSLIFIPILSRTYCDPDCYAWQNEFLAFQQMIGKDNIGRTIRLSNGNVTSRVLPICIHDLDQSDLRLIESHLKGKLRSINFVFKSPGVNRPLRAHEEDPLNNANHVLYRDQINKVANAIHEIIASVRSSDAAVVSRETKNRNPLLDNLNLSMNTVRSIAVMPLVFSSHNPDDEFLSMGFAEDLFSSLKQIRALRPSIQGLNGANDESPLSASSTMALTGNMTIEDRQISIHVQLEQTKTGVTVWQGQYQCDRDSLFTLRPVIVSQLCESLSITLKQAELQTLRHHADASAAALELYWKGRYHWRKRGNDLLISLECFQQAADLAPGFADAHAGIANAAVLLGHYGIIPLKESIAKCKESALKALSIDPSVLDAYYSLAYILLCCELGWPESEHTFRKVFGINSKMPAARSKYNVCLNQILSAFEETEEEPVRSIPHFLQAYSLMQKGKYEEGLKVARMAVDKESESFMAHRAAGLCYLKLGYENEAIETLKVAAQLSNRHPWVLFDLIGAYAMMSNNEEAQSIMEETMEYVNSLPARINDFFFQPT